MKNTLFKVHVDTYLIVAAPDAVTEDEIYYATKQAIQDHLADVEFTDITFEKLESIKDLPKPWMAEYLPFNSEELTIGEILNEK